MDTSINIVPSFIALSIFCNISRNASVFVANLNTLDSNETFQSNLTRVGLNRGYSTSLRTWIEFKSGIVLFEVTVSLFLHNISDN